MSRRLATALVMISGVAACDMLGLGEGGSSGSKVAESGTSKGSAGGFSATMSAELARAGIGEPTITAPPPAAGSAAAGAGSAMTTGTPTGSAAETSSGSAAATGTAAGSATATGTAAATGSATASTGTAATGTATTDSASGTSTGTSTGTAAGTATGTTPGPSQSITPNQTATKTTAPPKAVGAVAAPANRTYVKPSGDVAAIKLDLEPNWDRDVGQAGTFSLVVKLPGTDDTRLFMVQYGYEDQSAPQDCDAYRKFLEDKGMMKVSLNRQRGAACYIEGTDQGGTLAYRFMLTYGGKRLTCHGSLYKDPASSALGDLRDKVLLQAKKICETLAL